MDQHNQFATSTDSGLINSLERTSAYQILQLLPLRGVPLYQTERCLLIHTDVLQYRCLNAALVKFRQCDASVHSGAINRNSNGAVIAEGSSLMQMIQWQVSRKTRGFTESWVTHLLPISCSAGRLPCGHALLPLPCLL